MHPGLWGWRGRAGILSQALLLLLTPLQAALKTFPNLSRWPSCPRTRASYLGAFACTVKLVNLENLPFSPPRWFLLTFKAPPTLPCPQPHPQPQGPTCPLNPAAAQFLFTSQVTTCMPPPSGSSLRPAGPIPPLSSFPDSTPHHRSVPVSLSRLGLCGWKRGVSCHICHLSTQHRTWHRQGVSYSQSRHGSIHLSLHSPGTQQ